MSEPLDWARVPYARLQRDVRVQHNVARWITLHERAGHLIRRRMDGGHAMFEAVAPTQGIRALSLDTPAPDLDTQLIAASRSTFTRPWRLPSIREALGVPAIFRAASLIANTTGALSMRGLRNEVEVDPQDRPRLIVRPDPNRTPRDFYRDTAWNLARFGEAFWYVPSRDRDGLATSLFNILDTSEVHIERNDDDLVRPHITWGRLSTRDGTLRREDMRILTFLPDETGLRGMGPLQACGAAVSVAVESQEWAANFFAAGGYPSIWIKAAGELGGGIPEDATEEEIEDGDEAAYNEAQRLKAQWMGSAANTPKVTDESILDIKQFDPNPQGAQMLDARDHVNGDAARMFGIPGSLLDYRASSSNLTYQNVEMEFTKWLRAGLRTGYLEPIEQAMSDLLTRSTVSRFLTEQLEAPDVKTRFEVYQLAMEVFGPEEGAEYARKREGLAPGDVENAPIPFAPPVRVPRVASTTMRDVRCPRCKRLVVRAVGPVEGRCRHCKLDVTEGAEVIADSRPAVTLADGAIRLNVEVPAPHVHVEPTQVDIAPTVVGEDQLARIEAQVRMLHDEGEALRGAISETEQRLLAKRSRRLDIKRDKDGRIVSGTIEEIEEAG